MNSQRGQATVMTFVFLVVVLGMAALVLDVGSWYRADRATQSTADAAALAAAQALPDDAGQATALAQQYTSKNGGGSTDVRFPDPYTVKVTISRDAPGVFTKLFGLASVDVGAAATARVGAMSQARYVAPIVVNKAHPKLSGAGCPCFGQTQPTTIPLSKAGAPGAFDLVNLDGSRGGTGPGMLADWILKGFDGYLDLGNYYSDPGAKWNSSQVHDALDQRLGTELLFPVYDTLSGNGANAQYHIIGWVGFHLTDYEARGSSGSISGWFTQVIWQGIQVQSGGGNPPSFGARSVELVN